MLTVLSLSDVVVVAPVRTALISIWFYLCDKSETREWAMLPLNCAVVVDSCDWNEHLAVSWLYSTNAVGRVDMLFTRWSLPTMKQT